MNLWISSVTLFPPFDLLESSELEYGGRFLKPHEFLMCSLFGKRGLGLSGKPDNPFAAAIVGITDDTRSGIA